MILTPEERTARLVERLRGAAERCRGAVRVVTLRHDAGCPAERTQRLGDCTCDPNAIEIEVGPDVVRGES